MDLSVVIPTLNEVGNLPYLIVQLQDALPSLTPDFQIVVMDGGSADGTREVAARLGGEVHVQQKPGYGGAIVEGFSLAKGDWILTMDGDLSHLPEFIEALWEARGSADLVIASRYIAGGSARTSWLRKRLSVLLNRFFSGMLSLPYRDLSSGFRLYRREALAGLPEVAPGYESLLEILIRLHLAGRTIREIPFDYAPRQHGFSKTRIARFALAYLQCFRRMRRLVRTHSADGNPPAS